MERSDINMYKTCGKRVYPTHLCVNENGFEHDDEFKIVAVIGDFEHLVIENQYGNGYIINPNQLKDPE